MSRWDMFRIKNNCIATFWVATLIICVVFMWILVPIVYPYVLIFKRPPRWIEWIANYFESIAGEMMAWILGRDKL